MLTVADIKSALQIKPGVTKFDQRLEDLERAAVAFMEEVTFNRFQTPAERRVVVSGPAGSVLWLVEVPAQGSVTVEHRISTFEDWTAVAEDDVRVEGRRIILRHGWTKGCLNYRVTWTAGFEAADVPVQVREAVLALVRMWFRAPDQGVSSMEQKDMAVAYFATNIRELPPIVVSVANRYKPKVPMPRPEEVTA